MGNIFLNKKFLKLLSLSFLFLIFIVNKATAEIYTEGNKYVKTKIVSDHLNFLPSDDTSKPIAKIGVLFDIAPGWHIYWKESGDAGLPTEINWTVPADFTAGDLEWPEHETIKENEGITTYGYHKQVLLFTDLYGPKTSSDIPKKIDIQAEIKWLVCKDICVPGRITINRTFDFSKSLPEETSPEYYLFKKYGATVEEVPTKVEVPQTTAKTPKLNNSINGFGLALLMAFLAGVILNLMPCVLPVVSIKALSLLQSKDKSPAQIKKSSFFFSLGIWLTFLVLALIIIGLRASGEEAGWGFHFQHPGFVFVFLLVVFSLSLSFFDLFQFQLPFLNKLNKTGNKLESEVLKNLFDGALATLLSTPCLAPFLSPALGYAFTQSAYRVCLIFITIGIGLSLPYLLLIVNPNLLKFLPKPGPWLGRFKQLMGFFLLGTAIWLLGVLESLTDANIVWMLVILLNLALFIWFIDWTRHSKIHSGVRIFISTLLGFSLVYLIYDYYPALSKASSSQIKIEKSAIDWKPFSYKLLNKLRAKGKTIFIDFTASWCITCKINEKIVIQTDQVAQTIKDKKIVALKGDWTRGDTEIAKALKDYGAEGVPYYVIIRGKEQPQILPTLLTVGKLVEELSK